MPINPLWGVALVLTAAGIAFSLVQFMLDQERGAARLAVWCLVGVGVMAVFAESLRWQVFFQ
jgi:hypothetical protein